MIRSLLFIGFVFLLSCTTAPQKQSGATSWAQGLVWYQIFPERFYNGSTANDPTAAETPDADNMPGWQISPWTADWYQLQPWELKKSPNFYDDVYTRRYGGDLIGVIQKLPYLKELGIEGIYFNPLFESPSLHKYDGSSYHHIDDNFGPNPQKDKQRLAAAHETDNPDTWIWTSADSTFLELINKAHQLGMKVVIDGVFNHMGDQSFAFLDIKKNQQNSRYKNWFDITRWDDPATPENEFSYKGWWGVQSLPELKEDANGIVHGPREYIFNATKRWLDPNSDGNPQDGVDGWRLDVAEEVAMPFWVEWNALVKSVNPQAITVAEIWHDASKWIHNKAFDGTMNYLFSQAVQAYFINQQKKISAKEFGERLKTIKENYGAYTSGLLWNLMDSHDTDRLSSIIVNPDRNYDRLAGPRDNPSYKVRKPNKAEWEILKQVAAFQFTFRGAPMIYYGTEAGMWGADDPDDRKPMLWPEMSFADETHHPLKGRTRPRDVNRFDRSLFEFYKKLIQLRNTYPVLKTGSLQLRTELSTDAVFAFSRKSNKASALLFFNRSNAEQPIALTSLQGSLDAWSGKKIHSKKMNIPGRAFRIFIHR